MFKTVWGLGTLFRNGKGVVHIGDQRQDTPSYILNLV